MIILTVPFSQKEEVKKLGAIWNPTLKKWTIKEKSPEFNKWIITERKALPNKILSIELIPKSCWFSNVRNHISQSDWNKIKQKTFAASNNQCQICGGIGQKHPVECHEVWFFDKDIQILKECISLCPECHESTHIGLAQVKGNFEKAKDWIKQINSWTEAETLEYINKEFKIWEKRSSQLWKLDLSWLKKNFDLDIKTER